MNKKIVLYIALIISQLSCNRKAETETTESENLGVSSSIRLTENQYKNISPELADMKSIPFSSEIEVNGMVDVPPENIAMVSSAVNGIIQTITHNVLPGKFVQKGSVLAVANSMELVQIQQEYLESYLKNEVLTQEFVRQKTLVSEGAGVEKKLQESESNLKLNKAKMAGLEARLRMAKVNIDKLRDGEIKSQLYIYAPISGFVKEVRVNTGTNFTSNDILFELISKEHLHVELKVFEKDAPFLKDGQKVIFDGNGLPLGMTGTIFLISKSFDESSRAINVHVHIDKEVYEKGLIPGQYLSGKIQIDEMTANVLPESALIRDADDTHVLVQKNNSDGSFNFEKVKVQIGKTKDGNTEIISPSVLSNVLISKVHLINGMSEIE